MSTVSIDDYYAREADRIARGPQLYGGNAAIVHLRCFKYYHPDQGSWMTAPNGKDRWLSPKMSRVYGILHRFADSGQRMTMTAIALEAMCSTATVSRAVQKLQAWEFFAIDIVRGRSGGITVRRRHLGDHLKHYAAAAWARIRAWINVASRPALDGTGPEQGMSSTSTSKDATFTEEAALERLGARVLAGEISVDTLSALNGRDRRRAREEDLQQQRYRDWADQVIAERARLDREEPDWHYADLR